MNRAILSAKHALVNPDRQRLAAVTVAALVIGAAGAGVLLWPSVRPDCTVRYRGTSANAEFTGWGAGSMCGQLEAGDPGYIEAHPVGVVVCRLEVAGQRAVVRDRGLTPLFGELLCDGLRREANQ